MILFNPKKPNIEFQDERSKEIALKTIEFFENKGLKKIKEDFHERKWYRDYLDFQKKEGIFYTLLTPPEYGDEDCRWDTWRNNFYNELLSFYGTSYWYTWQVSILGLGPIWMSKNEEAKRKAARLLKGGAVFAFGLSEREHGADIYSTEMALEPQEDGTYLANGEKYYIGNGNEAEMVSTFGHFPATRDYVFFVSNFRNKGYELVDNVVAIQDYVADFKLKDYRVTEADILSKARYAWECCLNTVNVGKYQLGWASIGVCEHALYEALNHAAHRELYSLYVTDMPHVQRAFVDSFTRIAAMRLFGLRASDYFRTASLDDRRYLLYNPTMKMKVTTQGEDVMDIIWDIIAAKGFEKDTYFEMGTQYIRALPRLEGTVHVNIMLLLKFMQNYFFNPKNYPEIGKQIEPKHDEFLFNQGSTHGLMEIQFHDYHIAYNGCNLPNVKVFKEQTEEFRELLVNAPLSEDQYTHPDFTLNVGELFALVAYGQLILESIKIYNIEDDITDQIFDFMVRDFSKFAVDLYSNPNSTRKQDEYWLNMIKKPVPDEELFNRVWENHVYALKDVYEMNE